MADVSNPAIIRIAGLAAGLLLLGTAIFLRARLAELDPSTDPLVWWRAGFSRALLIWSLAESAALIGIILFMFTGSLFELAVLGAGGLGLLLLSTPDRIGPA